jgi:hypothetical protein
MFVDDDEEDSEQHYEGGEVKVVPPHEIGDISDAEIRLEVDHQDQRPDKDHAGAVSRVVGCIEV